MKKSLNISLYESLIKLGYVPQAGILSHAEKYIPAPYSEANSLSIEFLCEPGRHIMEPLLFQTRRCFDVPAGAFKPAPKITSTVLAVHPVDSPLQTAADEFYAFVKLCFAERRKTLWNNLAPHIEKDLLAFMFYTCGLEQRVRAEQLPANVFLELFERIKNRQKD